jgi:hypothetical protein
MYACAWLGMYVHVCAWLGCLQPVGPMLVILGEAFERRNMELCCYSLLPRKFQGVSVPLMFHQTINCISLFGASPVPSRCRYSQ